MSVTLPLAFPLHFETATLKKKQKGQKNPQVLFFLLLFDLPSSPHFHVVPSFICNSAFPPPPPSPFLSLQKSTLSQPDKFYYQNLGKENLELKCTIMSKCVVD